MREIQALTLFEHERRSFHQLGWLSNEIRIIEILAANERAGRELIRIEHDGIKATQNVGLMRLPRLEIQVLPKVDFDTSEFSTPEHNPRRPFQERAAAENLLQMLAYASRIEIKHTELSNLQKQELDWFELLIHLFASELHHQILQGPHRNYQQRDEPIPFVKGKWLVSKQLARRPYQWQILHMSFDEFTQDNLLNRTFRLATELLLGLTRDKSNRRMLTAIRGWLIDIPVDFSLAPSHLRNYTFSRLNSRFETSFQLARLFLSNEAPQMRRGVHGTFSFMFDMNDLFEKFVAGFMLRHRQAIFGEHAGKLQIEFQGGVRRVHLMAAKREGHKEITLKPDITFRHVDGSPALILDTKYKLLPLTLDHTPLYESDCYQALAYMTRLECKKALLLYPQMKDDRLYGRTFQVSTTEMEIAIGKLDIQRSLSDPTPMIQRMHQIIRPQLGKG